MTTAAVDPPAAIAEAGQELLDALRDLVSLGNRPELLDDVSKLLSRARRKVNRAARAAEESTKVTQPAPPSPTSAGASGPVGHERTQAVTVAVPRATPRRRPARGDRSARIQGAPMSQPQQPNRPRTATPTQRRRRPWVWFWVVVILLVSLGMAVAGIVIMAAGSDEPADPGSRPTTTRAFPPAAKPCAEVLQPGLILEQDTVGWGCLNEEGSRISAGSYVCADGRWLLVSMLLYQVWGYVGEPLRPVGTTSDPALRDALTECGVTDGVTQR